MPGSILQIQTPDEAEAVFYEAFMHGDKAVMAEVWASDNVVCVHPGSGVIMGYDAVVRSWKHILENSHGSEIRYTVRQKMLTDNIAVHIVAEEMMDKGMVMGVVIATNVYQRFEQGWLMIEHHASLIQQRQDVTLQ